MLFRRFLPLVLVLVLTSVLSSCVFFARMVSEPPSTDPPLAENRETVTRPDGGSSTLIVRAELVELPGRSAWEAVDILNRRWLQIRRGFTLRGGPIYARVAVDGISRGTLDELRRWSTEEIDSMQYLNGPEATIKYGGGFPGGIIEVTTRSAR